MQNRKLETELLTLMIRCSGGDLPEVTRRFVVLSTDLAGLFNIERSIKDVVTNIKYGLGPSTATYIQRSYIHHG